jgi:hypothetical protein
MLAFVPACTEPIVSTAVSEPAIYRETTV